MSEKEDTFEGLVLATAKGDQAAADALHDWLEENEVPKSLTAKEARELTNKSVDSEVDIYIAKISVMIKQASTHPRYSVVYNIPTTIPTQVRYALVDKLRKSLGYKVNYAYGNATALEISWDA